MTHRWLEGSIFTRSNFCRSYWMKGYERNWYLVFEISNNARVFGIWKVFKCQTLHRYLAFYYRAAWNADAV